MSTTLTGNTIELHLDSTMIELFNFPNGNVQTRRKAELMTMLAKGHMSVEVAVGTRKPFKMSAKHEGGDTTDPRYYSTPSAISRSLKKKAFVKFHVDFENTPKEQSVGSAKETSQAVKVEISKFNFYVMPQAIETVFKIYISYGLEFDSFKAKRASDRQSLLAQSIEQYTTSVSTKQKSLVRTSVKSKKN